MLLLYSSNLQKSAVLVAEAGVYTSAGASAALLLGRQLTAGAGSYSIEVNTTPNVTLQAEAGIINVSGAPASMLVARQLHAGKAVYEISGKTAQAYVGYTAPGASKLNYKEAAVQGLQPRYPGKLDPFIKAILGIWYDEEELEQAAAAAGGRTSAGDNRHYSEQVLQYMRRRREQELEDEANETHDEIMINMTWSKPGAAQRVWKQQYKTERKSTANVQAKLSSSITKTTTVSAALKIDIPAPIKIVIALKETNAL